MNMTGCSESDPFAARRVNVLLLLRGRNRVSQELSASSVKSSSTPQRIAELREEQLGRMQLRRGRLGACMPAAKATAGSTATRENMDLIIDLIKKISLVPAAPR